MTSSNLLQIDGLVKRYRDFTLENAGLAVPAGSIVGLIGSNGAGKTTTIKAALGLVRPDEGSIELLGEQVVSRHPDYVGARRAAQLRQDVGVVFDTCAFPLEYRVRDAGALCAKAYMSWNARRFEQLTQQMGLSANKKVKELSRGMGMKLTLACALAHSPKLLVLDEATAGLDPLARDEVLDLLHAYTEDESCGVLLSSHITSDLERCADHVVCIDDGRIVFSVGIDTICDMAGIARCRASELETIERSGAYPPGELRIMRDTYSTNVLVPDRFAFAEAFPEIALDRANIDDYLAFMLKGETR